jgi:AcrR family transcriptional regulator
MKIEPVVLAHQVNTEAVMGLLADQPEPTRPVDARRGGERMVRPQSHSCIAGVSGKRDARVDQPATDARPASVRFDQKDAQLGGVTVGGDTEHAADAATVRLGDPTGLSYRVMIGSEIGDDPRDQGLERRIPTELFGIDFAMLADHPAEIARASDRADLDVVGIHDRLPPPRRIFQGQLKQSFQWHSSAMNDAGRVPSARRTELLEAAYRYVLERGLADLSLRPLATSIGSSPRVLLFLFGSKEGLVRELLGRARADELAFLEHAPDTSARAPLATAIRTTWAWLADPAHRALLTLWCEAYARSLVDPDGAWGRFARQTVDDWLAVLARAQPARRRRTRAGTAERTLALAVLRGALLDLLATGDTERATAAVELHVHTAMDGP